MSKILVKFIYVNCSNLCAPDRAIVIACNRKFTIYTFLCIYKNLFSKNVVEPENDQNFQNMLITYAD